MLLLTSDERGQQLVITEKSVKTIWSQIVTDHVISDQQMKYIDSSVTCLMFDALQKQLWVRSNYEIYWLQCHMFNVWNICVRSTNEIYWIQCQTFNVWCSKETIVTEINKWNISTGGKPGLPWLFSCPPGKQNGECENNYFHCIIIYVTLWLKVGGE